MRTLLFDEIRLKVEHSNFFKMLSGLPGVFNQEEREFRCSDEQNYVAFGVFNFNSSPEERTNYKYIYGAFKKTKSIAISFSMSFIFEDIKQKVVMPELLRLIDEYNKSAIGIKVHSMEQESESELFVSFNTEFYLPPQEDFMIKNTESMQVALRFLENAPLGFSEHLKKNDIYHDYLHETEE